MEPLLQASSSFGPVNNTSRFNFINPPPTTNNQYKTSTTIDVPIKLSKNKQQQQQQHKKNHQADIHWNCYRDCVSIQSMIENYTNFKRTLSPVRLMTWTDGAWVELSGEVLSAAKSAFSDRRPMVEVEVDGKVVIFDFFRMLQVDVGTGLQRSIAWIDINGDCFFPKFFVDESLVEDDDDRHDDDDEEELVETVTPKIEIEIKIGADSNNENNKNDSNIVKNNVNRDENNVVKGRGKRKVRDGRLEAEEEDTADSSCNNGATGTAKRQRLDPALATAAPGMVASSWPNARLVMEEERSFLVVKDLFMSGMKKVDPCVRITAIHQFTRTGPIEKARWEGFQKQMEMTQTARGRSNTVFAWHGASKKGVIDILAHGFGWRSKVPGPQAHGVGVYLSPARMPHLSDVLAVADEDGEKHVVLCRVILGNVEKVDAGSEQFHSSSLNFDSGTDDLVNPKWYVVWSENMNTHILPECVVSYNSSEHPEGTPCSGEQTIAADIMNWIPNGSSSVLPKLFSKLNTSLPASKLEELKALCMTFKAGRMAKDLFIKLLKAVVGNEVLLSAISEIRCSN